ncbi:MAG: WYL domain-containing protein [Prevotella sp.]|nr:WYL domain-containing protein [Prevotella sp.]
MPVDKQVLLRYQVLNKCFRNRYREYTIDDLVDECNKALRRMDKPDVSKRTIQNDINILEADYGIMLDEKLKQGKKRLYRYVNTNYSIPLFRINDEERHKLQDAIRVLEYFDDVIGVTVPENDSEDVVIRISKPRFEFIRTKPLHLSQRIVEENDNFAVVTINVKLNKELEALVLSYGSDMEVLSPDSFRARIADKIKILNQQYTGIKDNDQ